MDQALLLHSVSYSGSWGQQFLPLEDFIVKAASLGFQGVMLMAKRPHLSILDCPAPRRAALRGLLAQHGLRHLCLAGYTNFTADLEHGEIPQSEIQIRHTVELAELARDLGGSLVRVFTGYDHPAASYGAQWKIVVESLRECAARAAEYGVTIGVQNHHDIANDWASHRDLIEEVNHPNCRALYDAWAPALQGTDIAAAARQMADLTVHTTIANYQLRPRFRYQPDLVNYERQTPAVRAVPIDEGFIDYTAFLNALREAGFQGTIAYEMCSPLRGGGSLENLDRCAARFLAFMRSIQPASGEMAAVHQHH